LVLYWEPCYWWIFGSLRWFKVWALESLLPQERGRNMINDNYLYRNKDVGYENKSNIKERNV
jgi:hypothetical protein